MLEQDAENPERGAPKCQGSLGTLRRSRVLFSSSPLLFVIVKHSKTIEKAIKSCVGFPTVPDAPKSLHQPLKGLHVRRGSTCAPTQVPPIPACCLQPARRKLLRPKEELLKQLLTSVSSADRHLVPAPGLPSYGTIARPYLAVRSKCRSVCPVSATRHFRGKTPLWAAKKVLCNSAPAKFVPVIFNN